jgi:hypothetical protein
MAGLYRTDLQARTRKTQFSFVLPNRVLQWFARHVYVTLLLMRRSDRAGASKVVAWPLGSMQSLNKVAE